MKIIIKRDTMNGWTDKMLNSSLFSRRFVPSRSSGLKILLSDLGNELECKTGLNNNKIEPLNACESIDLHSDCAFCHERSQTECNEFKFFYFVKCSVLRCQGANLAEVFCISPNNYYPLKST